MGQQRQPDHLHRRCTQEEQIQNIQAESQVRAKREKRNSKPTSEQKQKTQQEVYE